MNLNRRTFLRGLAGSSMLAAGGCFSIGKGKGKIRLACVGALGKGYSDWMPMLQSGMAELVAICDADSDVLGVIAAREDFKALGIDITKIPFYTDYRKLMDDAGMLGIQAMTISTPDHIHGPVAISAMKQGINVYVQKPLVRTLWELEYFNKAAKDNGVIVQMGNQGSSLDSMRRCTEILQSGIIGDVTEVHVWTNRPVWPQGKAVCDWVKGHPNGDGTTRKTLNWDAWLGTAKNRPFLGEYGKDVKAYDPWNLGRNVYHRFTWRGFYDFGCGAFGDMACHTMNLAFRGLELGTVTDAECVKIEEKNDIAYPTKSVVKMTYAARDSKIRKGVKLPAVTLFWYDGFDETKPGKSGNKPGPEVMPKVVKCFGEVPDTGCYIIGSKGAVLMQDDYGSKCAIAMNDEQKFIDVFAHEACKAVPRSIPFCAGSKTVDGKSTVEMKGFAEGHYTEFLHAIRGDGNYYDQTHSQCFADIEYCVPQMEGILVGCIAQQVPGKLKWDCTKQSFCGNAAAQALVKPFIREGWAF